LSSLAIPFFFALGISFATLILFLRPERSSKSARQRLISIQDSVRPQNAGAFGTELKDVDQRSHAARLGIFLARYRFASRLKVLLVHADSTLGVGETVLASAGAAAAGGAISFFFLRTLLPSIAVSIAASATPYALLRRKCNGRTKAFNTALPDAIDLMARALRAGHAMGSAIEMVADQAPEPLAFEFVQVYQQQRLGLQFRDALLEMGKRVPSRDLQFLITAILVQKETGGDLTEILDRTTHVIRERVRIEGEVRTRTAQGRLTGWILALLPVIMLGLLNLVSPGYSSVLFHDPVGQDLLYGGGIMIVVGALIIRKIVDVQV
jgi:tight adherence protein B